MGVPPSLRPPFWGERLHPGLSYVKKISAQHQAQAWNQQLAKDPVFGPSSGFCVAVGLPEAEVVQPTDTRRCASGTRWSGCQGVAEDITG